jgi:LacI family transcriptional regulator
MVTIQEIAEKAGVSVMTVSNVMNGNSKRVSLNTAERIKKIITENGYVPSSTARSLSSKSSRLIAGIITGRPGENLLADKYMAEFFGAVSLEVQKHGYYFMLRYVEDYQDVTRSLRSWNVDGAIFVGMAGEDIKNTIKNNKVPLIFTDSYSNLKQIFNVRINDLKGGELAADCLIRNGHTKLGFISYYPEVSELIQHRFEGFANEMRRRGLKISKKHIHKVMSSSEAPAIVKKHLAQMKKNEAPTAYFVSADMLALSLMRHFHEAGLCLPEDLSFIGFDNLDMASLFIPSLTTIAQDITKKAKIAVNMMLEEIKHTQNHASNIMLDVKLIERESVKRLK